MLGRKTLTARFPRREALLDSFTRKGLRAVIFVETARRLELAEQVTVVVEFPSDRRAFRLCGKVISRRRGSQGLEVEFPSDENRTLQLILDHAAGKVVDFVDRRSRRLACSFVVTYGKDAEFIREFTEDIGEGGTFIRTDRLFPVGTVVECKLKPPGYLLGVKLTGRVAWVKTTGQPRGMGVEFLFESERQRRKVRQIVRKLAQLQTRQVERKMQEIKESDRFR